MFNCYLSCFVSVEISVGYVNVLDEVREDGRIVGGEEWQEAANGKT
jgi:hypothetical protein